MAWISDNWVAIMIFVAWWHLSRTIDKQQASIDKLSERIYHLERRTRYVPNPDEFDDD